MNVNTLNACLIAGWLLVSIGAIGINWAAGLVASGAVLLLLTLLIVAKFGVFVAKKGDKPEGSGQ